MITFGMYVRRKLGHALLHFLNYGVDVKLTTVLKQETVKDI